MNHWIGDWTGIKEIFFNSKHSFTLPWAWVENSLVQRLLILVVFESKTGRNVNAMKVRLEAESSVIMRNEFDDQ